MIYTLEKGSYSSIAAKNFLNFIEKKEEIFYCPTIYNIFENLKKGYGVVPIENSIEGGVSLTMDLLLEYKPKILAEIIIPIHHNLIGFNKEKIKTILSHPQALAQCKNYIKKHNWKVLPVESTAKAVDIIAKKRDESLAAIGSEELAELYNLKILDSKIEDYKNNATRFILIGYDDLKLKPSKNYKGSIVLELKEDKPGALYRILKIFADREINLTRIESRPSKRLLGIYIFYIDFEYKNFDSSVIEELKKYTNYVINFGKFPSYNLIGEIK